MNRVTYISILIFLILGHVGHAQPLTQSAYEAYQAKDYSKAQELIDQSVAADPGASDAQSWLVRAFVYKELEGYTEPDTTIRNEIMKSHLKSIDLDPEKNFYNQNMKGIESTILRYYNQAVHSLTQLSQPEKAEQLYKLHKKLHLKYFEKDFTKTDVEFYRALGAFYNTKADRDSENPLAISGDREKALEAFKEVLTYDSLDYNANYNIGTIYYNHGVDLIMNIDPESSIEEMRDKQDRGVELFLKAEPYIMLAHKMTPERIEPVEALWGIYYGLSDYEKSDFYKKLLEKLKSK